MSMESAKEFAEKFYVDDEFIKNFYRNGGIKKNASDKEKTELILNTAKKIGYDFNKEEYEKASTDFFQNKGAWNAIKIFMHFNKVVKAAEKEGK